MSLQAHLFWCDLRGGGEPTFGILCVPYWIFCDILSPIPSAFITVFGDWSYFISPLYAILLLIITEASVRQCA